MTKRNGLADVVSAFGAVAKKKLGNVAAIGSPEDQLRAPLETLVGEIASLCLRIHGVILVGESAQADISSRPDYAVTRTNSLIGFLEIKAPGKGADPRRFTDDHDKKQWAKLKSLPNIIYTDGNGFSLWRNGELQGSVVQLVGDVETSGGKLAAPSELLGLFTDFLNWKPNPPRNAKQLAATSARLCRLLREQVTEELERNNPGLTSLAGEWRNLLFPDASDEQFADGYAQAVTFGLLVARTRDIPLGSGVDFAIGLDAAANSLRATSSLIGTALRLLIDDANIKKALQTSLGTLSRVLNEVDWKTITKADPEAWLYFYEDFLEVYDNALRKKTGSYYTPPEVVSAMVRLTDEALREPTMFNRSDGLAAPTVTICDPAVGTGTFLLGVLRQIAKTIEEAQGAGAVGPAIAAATERILGFELQFGPFAVAQLRLIAEMQSLIGAATTATPHLYVTDTLGDPYATEAQFSAMVAPIGESRKEANRIKREKPITVVIGNPPYKDKSGDKGGWIESGSDANKELATPMDRWIGPPDWGVGAHTKHLKNLYVYFWRWATLKVFGSGWYAATGEKDQDRSGIVCFITPSAYLSGPGFEKMRDDLRRDCAAIWVIDCSPEGHQPEVATRIFQGVQQPVCIVLAARTPKKDRETPARLRFTALPEGHRERAKFPALASLTLGGDNWVDGPSGWREPFLPEQLGAWASFPALEELFIYDGSGVMPGRTWIIAPDETSLSARWSTLIRERDEVRKELLFHPHEGGDKTSTKPTTKGLKGHVVRHEPVSKDRDVVITPTRYAFRSFDRQWIIPDNRLINRPNPKLWAAHSEAQVYLTAPDDPPPSGGPPFTLTGSLPDLNHYKGSAGGRVFPLWRDAAGTISNVKPALLAYLATMLGHVVLPQDVIAYLAAVMAHPAFTDRFQKDLIRPGLRVPMTASADLFANAVALGGQVVWLHTHGERFVDPKVDRPHRAPRLPKDRVPFISKGGTIPDAPEPLPDAMEYDAAKHRLHIGKGYVDNVSPKVWAYEVSGMNVLRQWFSYRRRDRSRPIIGDRRPPSPLSDIQPDHWLAEYTTDLIDLLNVLGRLVALEPTQAALLDEILAGPVFDKAMLTVAGALEAPQAVGGIVATSIVGDDAE